MYIFGYGSLVNVDSAKKTLLRELAVTDLLPAYLTGFKRIWGLKERVLSKDLCKVVSAVFLDIEPELYSVTLGAILQVDESEMDRLFLRERNYDCCEVTSQITQFKTELPELDKVFTFIAKPTQRVVSNDTDVYVLANYISIVEHGCQQLGNDFATKFKETSEDPNFPILEGEYDFI